MKNFRLIGAALLSTVATGAGAADVLNPGTGTPAALTSTVYTESFNTLKSTSQDATPANSLPVGWQAFESGSAANGSYQFGSSSSNTPGVWSYGSGTDRALGGHASTEVPLIYVGAIFETALAGTIDSLNIGYTGEQWQTGFNRATLSFQYSLDATSIVDGTWASFSALDFIAPDSAPHGGSQFGISSTNGNNAAFRTNVAGLISGLSIGSGNTFGIRWSLSDLNGVTSDDGLAIDDFRLTAMVAAVPEPTTWAMMLLGFGMVAGAARYRRRSVTTVYA